MSRESESPRRGAASLRARARPPRVFLGLVEIAGYYTALERGLREIGIRATAVDLDEHRFRYGAGTHRPPIMARPAIAARRRLATRRNSVVARMLSRGARLILMAWALWRFDVFVLASGESFFRSRDLPLLKRLGKRIVVVFHGSDLRPPYMDGPTMGGDSSLSIRGCAERAAIQKARIREIERHADWIVSHPPLSHFLETPYVRFLALGVPVLDLPPAPPPPPAGRVPVRILHSPSDPEAKGTRWIREAVERITAEGVPLEYVEVIGRPHADVLEELTRADLVIDQLYSDTPMATFAAEAASFGRPVIVGSCDWEEIARVVPVPEAAPVRTCAPAEVADAIRELATDAAARRALGARARTFAVDRCAPRRVAERFMAVIDGQIPEDWFADPVDVRHRCGACLPATRVRTVIAELVASHGRPALQLEDKPELAARLVDWAGEASSVAGPGTSGPGSPGPGPADSARR
ncbi:MAG: glycosyltransferase family 1 protein [Chloroflexota bacterium]|nr:MAG: glycosyltransferase family 1 protein [Chloroflexota bacterium]